MMDIDRLLADDARESEIKDTIWRKRFADVKQEFSHLDLDRKILLRVTPKMARLLTMAAKERGISRTGYIRRVLYEALLRDMPDHMDERDILIPQDRPRST